VTIVRQVCCCLFGIFILLARADFISGQQPVRTPEIPPRFTLDAETAARLRPQLDAQSVPPTGNYALGALVFERLVDQIPAASSPKFAWQLRIIETNQWNAYSSPDGSVYVESGLAKLAGSSSGLWAAILSHELAHVIRRDWARRYLYQRSIENTAGGTITLGEPGLPSSSWKDPDTASSELARFCRQMELEADREGLMLMVRAGYHPDFVPALHHLLHALTDDPTVASPHSKHPCWEERDRELAQAYLEASIEFAHLWPAWYASPGGNPPVVVFTEQATLRKMNKADWEITIPLRCQNLAGAVEVLVEEHSGPQANIYARRVDAAPKPPAYIRQVTGCTSPKTTITLQLGDLPEGSKSGLQIGDIYVLDSWGSVLARAHLPKVRR